MRLEVDDAFNYGHCTRVQYIQCHAAYSACIHDQVSGIYLEFQGNKIDFASTQH